MDQVASRQSVASPPLPDQAAGKSNGLAERVAAVHAARVQLGRDLDRLTAETRAQMGHTMEKMTWKLAAAGAGIGTGLVVRQLLVMLWKAARHEDPPANPAAPETTWGQALAWSMAMAAGMAVGKLVGVRGAAAGWRRATGTPPPGL